MFAQDAVAFGRYSDRWINSYVAARQAPPPEVRASMAAELRELVASHCSTMPADARCWGWKEPRSIYLLPFFAQELPDLRFLQVVRDGRDMADCAAKLAEHFLEADPRGVPAKRQLGIGRGEDEPPPAGP